jgi:hypothetical protein
MEGIIWADLLRNAGLLHKLKGKQKCSQKREGKLTKLVQLCLGTAFEITFSEGR